MILTTLMVASLLSVGDPSGDAVGAGELALPRAAIYRDISNFDVLNLSIVDQSTFAFEVSMASLENPWELPLGFSLPIIEVYASISPVNRNASMKELLPGSGMSLGGNKRWNYAFRITGDAIDVYTVDVETGNIRNVSKDVALSYDVSDNRIFVDTNIRLVGNLSVYAMSGSYDPFSESGWRGVAPEEQAWLLTGEGQNSPVLDVVVDDFSMQKRSIQAGVLPEITASARQPFWLWFVVAGLLACLLALILRPRKRQAAEAVEAVTSSKAVESSKAVTSSKAVDSTKGVDSSDTLEQTSEQHFGQDSAHSGRAVLDSDSPVDTEMATHSHQKIQPIQWTSWDESEVVSEDTMIAYDQIANEDKESLVQKSEPDNVAKQLSEPFENDESDLDIRAIGKDLERPMQRSLEHNVLEPPVSEPLVVETSVVELSKDSVALEQNPSQPEVKFQENLLPDIEDDSLVSSKQPPKGFTKRMKAFGLDNAGDNLGDSSVDSTVTDKVTDIEDNESS